MKRLLLLISAPLLFLHFTFCEQPDYTSQMEPIVDKYIEAWNTGNLSLLQDVVNSSFELRKIPDFQPLSGIKALEEYLVSTRTAIPDFFLKETEKRFISDTAVVVTWTFKGTYKGINLLPPTGSKIDIPGFSIIYFNNKKLTGEWIAFAIWCGFSNSDFQWFHHQLNSRKLFR
jgi:predicted ester cyclase